MKLTKKNIFTTILLSSVLLTGCGGGSGTENSDQSSYVNIKDDKAATLSRSHTQNNTQNNIQNNTQNNPRNNPQNNTQNNHTSNNQQSSAENTNQNNNTTHTNSVSSIKTDWGFKGFSKSGEVVTVHPGDSIQEIVDGLGSGDTIKFVAGTYYLNLRLKSNIILEGISKNQVTIKAKNGSGEQAITGFGIKNVIIRNLTIDGSNLSNTSAFALRKGCENILIENINANNAIGGSQIDIYDDDASKQAKYVTIKNVITKGEPKWHGITLRSGYKVVIDHVDVNGGKNGIDTALGNYIEVSHASIKNTAQSFKAPGSNHVFLHDIEISNNSNKQTHEGAMEAYGIKLGGNFKHNVYWDMRNITVRNSGNGIMDASEGNKSFTQLVVKNVKSYGNRNNNIVARGVSNLYSYNSSAKTVDETNGNKTISNKAKKSTPEADGVGYRSW